MFARRQQLRWCGLVALKFHTYNMHHATRLFHTQGGKCFPTFPGNGRNDNKFNLFYFSSLVFLKDSSGEKAKLQKCTQRRNNWFHIAYHEVLIALELQWHDMYFWLVCTTFHQWVYSRWIQFYFFFCLYLLLARFNHPPTTTQIHFCGMRVVGVERGAIVVNIEIYVLEMDRVTRYW